VPRPAVLRQLPSDAVEEGALVRRGPAAKPRTVPWDYRELARASDQARQVGQDGGAAVLVSQRGQAQEPFQAPTIPLILVEVAGPAGISRHDSRAVADPAADDTVFTLDTARRIGVVLRPDTGHRVRWRGQSHALRFGDVEPVLSDGVTTWRWPAVVGFSPAPLRYPILGTAGCLQFIEALFRGADQVVELATNRSYPGTIT